LQGDVSRLPNVLSDCLSGCLTLALDDFLHVFAEDFRPEDIVSMKQSVRFDTVAWTPGKKFVVVGLQSGHVQLVGDFLTKRLAFFFKKQ
jgi:hypothetical protein